MRVHRGFTLIEVLVVLFIVSMMTGIAVLRLPAFTRDDEFLHEAQRLQAVLSMAREEAILQSREYGFRFSSGVAGFRYDFLVYDELSQQWTAVEESPFSERILPPEVVLELTLEEEAAFVLGEDDVPPILILSSGELTPFSLGIIHRDDDTLARTLTSDGYSDIDWLDDEE